LVQYGTAIPDLYSTWYDWQLSAAVTPVPAPLFDVAENRSGSLRLPSQPIAGFGCESEVAYEV